MSGVDDIKLFCPPCDYMKYESRRTFVPVRESLLALPVTPNKASKLSCGSYAGCVVPQGCGNKMYIYKCWFYKESIRAGLVLLLASETRQLPYSHWSEATKLREDV